MYKAVIIDDEYPARLMLRRLASDHQDKIEIIAEASNGGEAVKIIETLNPDLIFLDINMPGKNAFEMLSSISRRPFVIFTTAHEEFAVKAFDVNAVDYLLKPIEEKRFADSIGKLVRFDNRISSSNIVTRNNSGKISPNNKLRALPIRTGDKIILLKLEDISYL